ncbi:tetratricopeptide repeat protein [Candidatus Gracilibacteria bacterium]|nr:tetratricopeptide repeat protein [Candidatus Gracilibacteria bacterium]
MKFLTSFFSKLYQYSTAFIVIGAPLFFVPRTGFSPDVTYYITMTLLVGIALVSYVISALLTKSWHTISRMEFISYFAFSIAVLLSVIFAKNPRFTLFGEIFDQFSAVSLLSLPVIMYLVRTLPETMRHKLKFILVALLSISALTFVTALMYKGGLTDFTKQIFSGFSSPMSFAAYIGIFAVACLFYVFKGSIPKKHKIAIAITSVLFFAWAVALSSQDSVRPNLTSTLVVGKNVMINEGVFGIGAGNFVRAWQLYRPQTVIQSPYFGYDFNQGSGTMSTLFVTIGIFGLLAFLMLVLSSLYSTFISYRQNPTGKEHFVTGLLVSVLVYFVLVSFLVPLSYAMLVVWMVVAGLGFAKARLSEHHPSKKIAFLMVPLAVILLVNVVVTINKVRAFSLYNKAQTVAQTEDVGPYIAKAISIYPYDGFHRVQVEYYIQANRNLVATTAEDQEALKNQYLENAQKAVDSGLAAVKSNPDNYQNYVSLGRAYELAVPFDKEGGFDRAKKSYQEAVKLYPENPYLYVMLARLEASAGTKEGVRSSLTEAINKKNNFADALYLMSQLEASDSKIDEALTYAIEAVKSAPNDPLVYIQAGLLFYGKQDYENAVFALKTALEKDQNNANVAYFLALALRDGGRPDLAKQIGDELLRRNPGNADLEAFLQSVQPKAEVVPAAKNVKK